MNSLKRDFGAPSTVALSPVEAAQWTTHKWTIPYRAIQPVAMAADALIIFATSIISGVIYHLEFVNTEGDLRQFAGFAAVVAALFVTLAKSRDLYSLSQLLNVRSQIRAITIKWGIVFLFLTAAAFVAKIGGSFSRGATIAFAASGLVALIGLRIVWRNYLADGLAVRRFSSRKIALIAEQDLSASSGLFEALTRHGLQAAHYFVLPTDKNDARQCKEVIAQAI